MNLTGKSRTLSAKQRKYFRDPEFRLRELGRQKTRHERYAVYPEYRRVIQLRKDRYRIRESWTTAQKKADALDVRLCKIVDELRAALREVDTDPSENQGASMKKREFQPSWAHCHMPKWWFRFRPGLDVLRRDGFRWWIRWTWSRWHTPTRNFGPTNRKAYMQDIRAMEERIMTAKLQPVPKSYDTSPIWYCGTLVTLAKKEPPKS